MCVFGLLFTPPNHINCHVLQPLAVKPKLEANPGERRIRRTITYPDGITRQIVYADRDKITALNALYRQSEGFGERKIPKPGMLRKPVSAATRLQHCFVLAFSSDCVVVCSIPFCAVHCYILHCAALQCQVCHWCATTLL